MLFLCCLYFCFYFCISTNKSSSSMETAATAAEWKEERAEFMFCFWKKNKRICYVQSWKTQSLKKNYRNVLWLCRYFFKLSNTFAVKQGRQRNKTLLTHALSIMREIIHLFDRFSFFGKWAAFLCVKEIHNDV